MKTITEKIEQFAQDLKTLVTEQMNAGRTPEQSVWFVNTGVDYATKFARVWIQTQIGSDKYYSRSLVCFIALEDNTTKALGSYVTGAVIKGDWKAPVKNGVRGHIDNWQQCFDGIIFSPRP